MQADLRGQYSAKMPWIQQWTNQHKLCHQATKNKSDQQSSLKFP